MLHGRCAHSGRGRRARGHRGGRHCARGGSLPLLGVFPDARVLSSRERVLHEPADAARPVAPVLVLGADLRDLDRAVGCLPRATCPLAARRRRSRREATSAGQAPWQSPKRRRPRPVRVAAVAVARPRDSVRLRDLGESRRGRARGRGGRRFGLRGLRAHEEVAQADHLAKHHQGVGRRDGAVTVDVADAEAALFELDRRTQREQRIGGVDHVVAVGDRGCRRATHILPDRSARTARCTAA